MVIDKVPVWSSLYKYRALIKVESKDYTELFQIIAKQSSLTQIKVILLKKEGM